MRAGLTRRVDVAAAAAAAGAAARVFSYLLPLALPLPPAVNHAVARASALACSDDDAFGRGQG